MAQFEICITEKGRELLAASVSGEPLTFSKMVLGDGGYGGDLSQVEGVISPKVQLEIGAVERYENQVSIQSVITPGLEISPFFWREVGVYAQDPATGGDVLTVYGNAGDKGDYLSGAGGVLDEKIINITILVEPDEVVTDFSGILFVTQQEFLAHTGDNTVHVTAAEKQAWNSRTVFSLTHAKSGAVHALTGLAGVSGTVSCIFMATANFAAGDTFTVDGEPYVLQLCNGEAAEDNLFVSGAYVPIIVDMAGKKVNFKAGGEKKELTTDIITFTQNWTVPKGVKTVVVRIFGGGGGGGNNVNGGGGGAGGSMAYQEISVTPEQVIPVTIATASSGNGGPSSFGSYLSASGGGAASGVGGGTGGTGGGGGHGGVGGDASYGGGGGGGINGRGGNGGTYGGGGGGGGPYGSQEPNGKAGGTGGTYGGDGGKGRTSGEPGTNTIGMGLEFEGAGAGGSSAANEGGAGGGGGGYGGNGGRGNRLGGGAGGGGGYGGNGGNGTNNDGGGGGGYGGNGGSGGGYGGGGGGGYGSAGNGGNGGASGGTGGSGGLAAGGGGADSSARRGAGGPGVCIITYMK